MWTGDLLDSQNHLLCGKISVLLWSNLETSTVSFYALQDSFCSNQWFISRKITALQNFDAFKISSVINWSYYSKRKMAVKCNFQLEHTHKSKRKCFGCLEAVIGWFVVSVMSVIGSAADLVEMSLHCHQAADRHQVGRVLAQGRLPPSPMMRICYHWYTG